jgi:hypothetical protein
MRKLKFIELPEVTDRLGLISKANETHLLGQLEDELDIMNVEKLDDHIKIKIRLTEFEIIEFNILNEKDKKCFVSRGCNIKEFTFSIIVKIFNDTYYDIIEKQLENDVISAPKLNNLKIVGLM